jgi:hypothetical protein
VAPEALQSFTDHQELLKQAREFVEQVKGGKATAEWTVQEEDKKETTAVAVADPALVKSADEAKEVKNEDDQQEASKDPKPKGETTEEGDVKPMEVTGENAAIPAEAKDDTAKPAQALSGPSEEQSSDDKSLGPRSLQEAYEILKEYEDAYSKVWDEDSQSWKYVLANQELTPEYRAITAGAAIGATTRLLSVQEREQEFRRWQTSILARIPNQPTFEQLGLKNRVFMLEQRRKRCLEDTEGDAVTAKDVVKKPKGDDFEDESEGEEVKEGDEDASEDVEKPPKKIELAPRKVKEGEEVEEQPEKEAAPEALKIIKPMSLAAVPSFYDQDLNRIRAVHGDLMGFSLMQQSQQSMTEATNQYNAGRCTKTVLMWVEQFIGHSTHTLPLDTAHRRSNQLYDHRTRLQQNLAYFVQKSRSDLAKVNSDHTVQVAVARQQWIKQKIEHDQKRAKQFLPSTWGHAPFGTNATQQYQQRGGIQAVVASCMADVVDGVILVLEGSVPNTKFAHFQPPIPPANQQTGETLQQQVARSEQEFRQQLEQTTSQYQQSEETRQRAWTKMMKAKAELEASTGGVGRQGYLDISNYQRIPLPPLRNSQLQQMPQDFAPRSNVASFTPPPDPGTNSGSVSKYSAAKVRERMSNDGSVAPVAEPKRDKEGLFVRPAGRTRKGMKWNAIQGIWVPQGSE